MEPIIEQINNVDNTKFSQHLNFLNTINEITEAELNEMASNLDDYEIILFLWIVIYSKKREFLSIVARSPNSNRVNSKIRMRSTITENFNLLSILSLILSIFYQEKQLNSIILDHILENNLNFLDQTHLDLLIAYLDIKHYSCLVKLDLNLKDTYITSHSIVEVIIKSLMLKSLNKKNEGIENFHLESDLSNLNSIYEDNYMSKPNEINSLKLNEYYLMRIFILLETTNTIKNFTKNSNFLKILVSHSEFSQVFKFLKNEDLKKLISISDFNFILFFKNQIYNVAIFISNSFDFKSQEIFSRADFQKLVVDSFDINEKYINFEVFAFLYKRFFKFFTYKTVKTLIKKIEDVIYRKLEDFLLNSFNPLTRLILLAEMIKHLTQDKRSFEIVSNKMVMQISKYFNKILDESDDYEVLRYNLMQTDLKERTVLEIVIENDFLDFLKTDAIYGIVMEEWNEKIFNYSITNSINSNSIFLKSINFEKGENYFDTLKISFSKSYENSFQNNYFFKYSQWKNNIKHKFILECLFYFVYFFLIFSIFVNNLQIFSELSPMILKISRNETLSSLNNETENFHFYLNKFKSNTIDLYRYSLLLYLILLKYLSKFIFSLKTNCRIKTLICEYWFFDICVIFASIYKDYYIWSYSCVFSEDLIFTFNQTNGTLFNSNKSEVKLINGDYNQLCNFMTSIHTTFLYDTGKENQSDFFNILGILFFIFRLIGINISAFLIKLIFYLKLNSEIGPFLEIIKYIVLKFLYFCILLIIIVFITTVFINFCFFDVNSTFRSFWASFVAWWEILIGARTGSDLFITDSKDNFIFVNVEINRLIGQLFTVGYTVITTVLILNSTIAMISKFYNNYNKISKAIYLKEIINFKNSHIYHNVYDSLLRGIFPFTLVSIPFIPLIIFLTRFRHKSLINGFINYFYYFPYLVFYLSEFFFTSVIWYFINLFTLIWNSIKTILNCEKNSNLLLFTALYPFIGIGIIFRDLFLFVRIVFCRKKRKKEIETNKKFNNYNQEGDYNILKPEIFRSKNDQVSVEKSAGVFTFQDFFFIKNFCKNYANKITGTQMLVHAICSKCIKSKLQFKSNRTSNSGFRRNNLFNENLLNDNFYTKLNDLFYCFDLEKNGFVNCNDIFFFLESFLNFLIIKLNLNSFYNSNEFIKNSYLNWTSKNIIEKNKNFSKLKSIKVKLKSTDSRQTINVKNDSNEENFVLFDESLEVEVLLIHRNIIKICFKNQINHYEKEKENTSLNSSENESLSEVKEIKFKNKENSSDISDRKSEVSESFKLKSCHESENQSSINKSKITSVHNFKYQDNKSKDLLTRIQLLENKMDSMTNLMNEINSNLKK